MIPMVVRVKIVGADVEGVVRPADTGVQDQLNSALQLEPGVSPPDSKGEILAGQQEVVMVCCLLTFYCYCGL